jgi:hypothetical protein
MEAIDCGKQKEQFEMDLNQRAELIAQYEDGYQMIVNALEGITDAEMDARPAPNEWSAREVVHHLADSEMTSAIRLRLLIAAEGPTILGYDEAGFARRLYYDRPITASLEAFKAARRSTAEILHRMTDAEWSRAGTHTDTGRYTAEDWLAIYADHAVVHAAQIRAARTSGGQ